MMRRRAAGRADVIKFDFIDARETPEIGVNSAWRSATALARATNGVLYLARDGSGAVVAG